MIDLSDEKERLNSYLFESKKEQIILYSIRH